jgi:hypothetical protein
MNHPDTIADFLHDNEKLVEQQARAVLTDFVDAVHRVLPADHQTAPAVAHHPGVAMDSVWATHVLSISQSPSALPNISLVRELATALTGAEEHPEQPTIKAFQALSGQNSLWQRLQQQALTNTAAQQPSIPKESTAVKAKVLALRR